MNPFKYGQVVGGDDFCPRPALIKQMTGFLQSGQNVVVLGERRIGKTSLICEAARRSKKRRVLYADLLEIKSADDLCKRLVKAIISLEQESGLLEKALRSLSQLRPSVSLDPLTGKPSVSLDATVRLQPESIEGLLDMVQTIHQRRPLVVVLDEFQDILNLKDSKEAIATLRSKIQFHTDIPYVFAGSVRNRMAEIFTHPDSAFFKSAALLNVGRIDPGKFSDFLQRRFAQGKRKVDGCVMEKAFELADEIPGDIQQLCAALWEVTSYKGQITEDVIPNALQLIFARESKGYEAVLLQITALQLRCLVGLAQLGGKTPMSKDFLRETGIATPASVQRALSRLEKLKIIYRHEGRCKFVNPFLKSWLIHKDY